MKRKIFSPGEAVEFLDSPRPGERWRLGTYVRPADNWRGWHKVRRAEGADIGSITSVPTRRLRSVR